MMPNQEAEQENLHKVVIVEDEQSNLLLLQSMLRRLDGIDTIAFTDPTDALVWLSQNETDLVFVEYNLPKTNGVEFIREFKKLSSARLTPVVMISSNNDQKIRLDALENGANEFLTKPIDRFELLARTKNMLTLRDSQIRLEDQANLLAVEVAKATKDLKASEERYALAARGANDGLWDWDLINDKVYYSHRWKSMLGYTDDEISESVSEWFDRVHPSDVDQLQVAIGSHLQGMTEHFEAEFRIRHKDGSYRWVLSRGLSVMNNGGSVERFVGSQTDITERKKAEQRLLHDAFHDNLTGLPNRALFMDRVNQSMARGEFFAVLFIDMDRFKYVNDTLGHKAGDELLVVLARRLEKCCRGGDTIARFGGDEFTILLNNVQNKEEIEHFANRLLAEVKEPIMLGSQEVFPNISIGISMMVEGMYTRAEEIIRDSDLAMYKAKENGKGCFALFDEEMRNQTVSMFKMEAKLRRAMERGEIILYYQPIVDLQKNRIAGFESLMRWEDPINGIISPDEFISLAEETKLILPMGKWALGEAMGQLGKWHDTFPEREPYFITVNVSGKQLEASNFIGELQPILKESKIPPACLHLEITESIIMSNPDHAETLLKELKSLGVDLSIDDFGTGYSSLSYLNRYPFDILKIDKSFVHEMLAQEKIFETIKIIIMLASSLGMKVVAEGLEDIREINMLRELGCDYGQGFYFAQPISAEMATKMLEQDPVW